MVSVAKIRLDRRKSTRLFKGIICDDISEFESHMPSQAVPSLWGIPSLQKYMRLSAMRSAADANGCGRRAATLRRLSKDHANDHAVTVEWTAGREHVSAGGPPAHRSVPIPLSRLRTRPGAPSA